MLAFLTPENMGGLWGVFCEKYFKDDDCETLRGGLCQQLSSYWLYSHPVPTADLIIFPYE